MESDIIVEGMNYLYDTFKVKCTRLIGDGDSSTMSKVREQVLYGMFVVKIACANHSVRSYTRALEKITKETKTFNGSQGVLARGELRRRLPRLAIGARTGIKRHGISCNNENTTEAVEELKKELWNGPSHVFGRHDECADFCDRRDYDEDGDVTDLMHETGVLDAVQKENDRVLCSQANTLIWNNTNNPAENFMSQMAKVTGGKRVDHSRSGGINRRSNIAALAYQSGGQEWHRTVHKKLLGESPRTPMKRLIQRRKYAKKRRKEWLVLALPLPGTT